MIFFTALPSLAGPIFFSSRPNTVEMMLQRVFSPMATSKIAP